MTGKLDDRRERHDPYYRRAKSERYAARSVYKLQELDKRFGLLRTGQRVLDLGCRPGSWLQYASTRVGPRGRIVGLDRQTLPIELPSHVRLIVGDVLTISPDLLRGERPCFELVLSDLAPDTSGIASSDQLRSAELFTRALDLSLILGCAQTAFVAKILMGEGFDAALAGVKRAYRRTKVVRPEATRRQSSEVYVVALERRQPAADGPAAPSRPAAEP
ncbi:MAG: RlmE family RNA methyltransferase [Proteobacteria bacterium]|nr:RlmE family RNA methyltransferase [Pseudomonadota bacterium]